MEKEKNEQRRGGIAKNTPVDLHVSDNNKFRVISARARGIPLHKLRAVVTGGRAGVTTGFALSKTSRNLKRVDTVADSRIKQMSTRVYCQFGVLENRRQTVDKRLACRNPTTNQK